MVDKKLNYTIALYVQTVMKEKELTYEQVSKNSNSTIHPGQVYSVANECHRQVSVDVLKALARGLRISEDEIFDVAQAVDRTNSDEQLMDTVLRKYNELSDVQKELVEPTLLMLDKHLDQLLNLKTDND